MSSKRKLHYTIVSETEDPLSKDCHEDKLNESIDHDYDKNRKRFLNEDSSTSTSSDAILQPNKKAKIIDINPGTKLIVLGMNSDNQDNDLNKNEDSENDVDEKEEEQTDTKVAYSKALAQRLEAIANRAIKPVKLT